MKLWQKVAIGYAALNLALIGFASCASQHRSKENLALSKAVVNVGGDRNALFSATGKTLTDEALIQKFELYCKSTESFEALNEGNFRDARTIGVEAEYRKGALAIYDAAKSDYCPS